MKRQTYDSQWINNPSGESYRRKQGPTGRKSVLEIVKMMFTFILWLTTSSIHMMVAIQVGVLFPFFI